MRSLKGVGDYTAAAVCSIAYDAPCAVVDGNVYRVLSRLFDLDLAIDTAEGRKAFAALADEQLDRRRPARYNQAIMDFGALQCTPANPSCNDCPLRDECLSLAAGTVAERPVKAGRTRIRPRYLNYLHLECGGRIALRRRPEGDIWQGLYDLPAIGTAAHCFTLVHDSERQAFESQIAALGTNTTLLVDTYNTLKSGVPNAIRAFNEVLRPKGITHCGIRFDSGDIAYLTKKARKMLDDAGWPDCKITVSNALDERLIAGLLRQGAQVDSFGVGERLITARSEPVFGGVYKLAAIEDKDGNIIPKIKISENVGKITNPHFKKVYRFYSKDSGMAEADYICLHDEVVDDTQPLEICDPDATWKKKVLTDFTARELLVPIFRGGKLVYQKPALDDIRAYCADQLTTLWPEVLRFDYPHNYYVDLSEKLLKIKLDLLNAGGKSQG